MQPRGAMPSWIVVTALAWLLTAIFVFGVGERIASNKGAFVTPDKGF